MMYLGTKRFQFHTFILCLVCQLMPMDTVTDGMDAEKFTHEPSVWKLTVLRLAGGLVSEPDPHLQWLVPRLQVGLLWHTGPELFIHGHSSSLI